MRTLAMAAVLLAAGDTSRAREVEGAPTSLTLEGALERALDANLDLARARAEVPIAEAEKRGARSLVLPRLNLLANGIRNSDEVAFGPPDDRRVILALNDWNYRFTVSQPLFAGLRDMRAYSQAKTAIDSAHQGVRAAEDGVLLQVAADYLSAVLAEALIDVEQKNRELAERRRQQARAFYEVGESTQVDVLRAETAIKEAERRWVTARQQRELAVGRLRIDLVLDGDINVREPDLDVPVPEEAALMRLAEASHPEIQRAEQARRIAALEIQKQRGAYWPVLTADAGFVRQRSTFPKDQYGFAALRLNVPLFQAGESGSRVAVAVERERQAALALELARRTVREGVRAALLEVETAAVRLALAQEQLAAAEAEYQQAFELYRSQEVTSLDVDAAQNSLASARRAVVTGRLERKLAQIQAWHAAGALKDTLMRKEVSP
jgi:outer membrane protein TolC